MKPAAKLVGVPLALLACSGEPEARPAPTPAPASVATAVVPDAPTFAQHVAPIVYAECAPCHHDGGPAPFAFTGYEGVREHAQQIAEITRDGVMPPWLPVAGHGEFVGERRLSTIEKETLAKWVEQGAPAGALSDAPVPPSFAKGWKLGEPDL